MKGLRRSSLSSSCHVASQFFMIPALDVMDNRERLMSSSRSNVTSEFASRISFVIHYFGCRNVLDAVPSLLYALRKLPHQCVASSPTVDWWTVTECRMIVVDGSSWWHPPRRLDNWVSSMDVKSLAKRRSHKVDKRFPHQRPHGGTEIYRGLWPRMWYPVAVRVTMLFRNIGEIPRKENEEHDGCESSISYGMKWSDRWVSEYIRCIDGAYGRNSDGK